MELSFARSASPLCPLSLFHSFLSLCLSSQYRSVWFSWGQLLGLETYIRRLESGATTDSGRNFGRKSLKKPDRPPLNDPTMPPSSSTSSSDETPPRSHGLSVHGISLPRWVMSRLRSNTSESKEGMQHVASSSRNETESYGDEENTHPSVALADPESVHPLDSSFSPLQT
jgi:hypothetical protein